MKSLDEAATSAKCLLEKGCKNHVLITLGAEGALLLSKGAADKPVHIMAPSVSAIDTTVIDSFIDLFFPIPREATISFMYYIVIL